jgi:Xaa-Pro aminopeptidase
LSLVTDQHAHRRARLVETTTDVGVDALLITKLVNVRYLTGFTGSNAALLVTPDFAVLATDGRYGTQAREESPDVDLVVDRELHAALVRRAEETHARRVGFEDEAVRAIKDDGEISLLARACRIADDAFAAVLAEEMRPGCTEREIAFALERHMRTRGADAASFDTIVASGPNSAKPHHQPTDRAVESGDFVKCDFGALVDGYHSDMTRTVVVGKAADWQREVYAVVAAAQAAGRNATTPDAACRDVDAAARAVVDGSDFAGCFVHPLGHGVGLEIHERPLLAATATDKLADHMPVTIEPGVYLPDRGGVRIEDTVVVRPDGPDVLTATTKELLEI